MIVKCALEGFAKLIEFLWSRFRVEYMASREIFRVTVIDACDLPAMDSDGKSDPYVEVCNFCP